MAGVSGIDHKCWQQSRQAGLRGTYRAFLSSYVQAIKSIVRRRDRDLPVANRNVSTCTTGKNYGKLVYPSTCSRRGDKGFGTYLCNSKLVELDH